MTVAAPAASPTALGLVLAPPLRTDGHACDLTFVMAWGNVNVALSTFVAICGQQQQQQQQQLGSSSRVGLHPLARAAAAHAHAHAHAQAYVQGHDAIGNSPCRYPSAATSTSAAAAATAAAASSPLAGAQQQSANISSSSSSNGGGGGGGLSPYFVTETQRALVLVDGYGVGGGGGGSWGTGVVLSTTSRLIATNAHVVDSFAPIKSAPCESA